MVGRFVAHGGRVTNNPIARFGSVSLLPNAREPVRDGRDRDVEAYLVEMRSHSGFSGSPVFLVIPQYSFRGLFGDTSLEDNQTRFRLIGIDTGHKIDFLPVLQRGTDTGWVEQPDLRAAHPTDVSIIAPIWRVIELLEREDIADEIKAIERELELRPVEQASRDRTLFHRSRSGLMSASCNSVSGMPVPSACSA